MASSDFGTVEDVDALECTSGSKTVRPHVCAIAEVSSCKDNALKTFFFLSHVPSLLNPYSWSNQEYGLLLVDRYQNSIFLLGLFNFNVLNNLV